MTAEYAAKGIVALPVSLMVGKADKTITLVSKINKNDSLDYLPSEVIIKERYENTIALEIPRYGTFQKTIRLLAQHNSEIVEVGGNRTIQAKVRSYDGESFKAWALLNAVELSYTWQVPSAPHIYGSLMIPVEKLSKLMRDAQTHNFEVLYVHDF